jgi:hypothetical protein
VGAFNQLQTYKQQIPALFHANALLASLMVLTRARGHFPPISNASCHSIRSAAHCYSNGILVR